MSFADLGLPPVVEKLAAEKSGLLLVTGASGSGKTSTMASILDWINTHRAVSILTVEDPIEVLHPDKKSVVESNVKSVSTLRAPPMRCGVRCVTTTTCSSISEFDDAETARAAIAAAETGHLVISSMRTTDPSRHDQSHGLAVPGDASKGSSGPSSPHSFSGSSASVSSKSQEKGTPCPVRSYHQRAGPGVDHWWRQGPGS